MAVRFSAMKSPLYLTKNMYSLDIKVELYVCIHVLSITCETLLGHLVCTTNLISLLLVGWIHATQFLRGCSHKKLVVKRKEVVSMLCGGILEWPTEVTVGQ